MEEMYALMSILKYDLIDEHMSALLCVFLSVKYVSIALKNTQDLNWKLQKK